MTLSAILAGGGFAQIALLLTLMDPLDAICRAYVPRGLSLCFYVDDIAMHFIGQYAAVVEALTGCINDTIHILGGRIVHGRLAKAAVGLNRQSQDHCHRLIM